MSTLDTLLTYLRLVFNPSQLLGLAESANFLRSMNESAHKSRVEAENKAVEALEKAAALETLKRTLLSENSRLSHQLSVSYQDKTAALLKQQSAEEQLRDERDGIQHLNATNRSLEFRLKTAFSDQFTQGEGMYMIFIDAKGTPSKSFRIPLKLQSKITTILTKTQKAALKAKS